jgi:hypothetical protein
MLIAVSEWMNQRRLQSSTISVRRIAFFSALMRYTFGVRARSVGGSGWAPPELYYRQAA